jgi:hypothetical protein
MADRRPIFELHIAPMFRTLDRIHMGRLTPPKKVDLASYDDVKRRHADIVDLVKNTSSMPPAAAGGPWPSEWIQLLERWKETGFGRLVIPAAANLQVAITAANRFALSCDVTLPHAGANAWFDIRQAQSDAQVYEVVFEPLEGAAPAPTTITVEERIRGPLTTTEIVVFDAAGEHRLPVPTLIA